MAGASDYLELKILDHMLRNQAFTPPATVYLALFTVLPNDAGAGGTEVTGGSYSRKSVTFNAASAGAMTNNGAINFGTASADWGTIVGWGLYDASTSGNMLVQGTFSPTKTISNGDACTVADATLSVTCD